MLNEDLSNTATYQIRSFTTGKINVNGTEYTQSLIISPTQLITNWSVKNVNVITDQDLLQLVIGKPDIILLGTGEKGLILPSKTLSVLLNQQFHVECMSTAAACRTYTILSAENRNVVAGLIV